MNILPKERKSTDQSKKAKRRLDLGSTSVSEDKRHPEKKRKSSGPVPPTKDENQKKKIKTENPNRQKEQRKEPSAVAKKEPPRHKDNNPPKDQLRKIKSEEPLKVKTEKQNSTDERILAKRLKTEAWARILKHKRKLYIPHTSYPRVKEDPESVLKEVKQEEVEVDKENSSLVVNVIATATTMTIDQLMRTPIKLVDHNSIIKFMSITPQLLSPLADV